MVEADPALSRDDLPQPYRMIWKVIDEYILDPMWLEITRIHPELLQDEEGKAFCTPHNQALQNICTPSAVTEQEFTFTSVLEREGLLFMSTDSGAFVVMDPEDNSILQSIRVVEEETPKTAEQLEAEAAAAAAADPKAKKGASPVDAAPPKPHRVTNMWISDASLPISDERLMNFSVVSIVEVEEAPPAEEGKKKGKGEVEEMLRVPKCVVTIVQAVLGMTEGFRGSLITLSVVGETVVPLEAAQVSSIGRIDISPNGCLMAASTSLGCSVYQLPVKIGRSRTKIGNVEQIVESEGGGVREETEVDLKREEEDTEDDVNKTRPALEVVLSLNQDFFGGRKVKSVKFFPLCMGHERKTKRERDDAAAATAAAAALPPVPEGGDGESKGGEGGTPTPPGGATGENYYHTAMTVVFEEASEWWILGMTGLADLALASNGETQGGVACADAVAACKLFSWSLPSSGSAFALDSDRSIVAIGSRDGTVCMWNLTTRALTSVMGRHETPVSTICFLQAPSGMSGTGAVDHFMVSGADDGTVCLYQLSIPPKAKSGVATDLFAKEGGAPGGDSACITSRFINYRMDVNAGTSIVGIRSIPGLPWAMVSCSDGMCMVYDVPNAQLLGRLALYSGMTSRQVDWKIMNFEEVISYKAPPQALPAAQDETDGQLGGEEMGQQQQQQQEEEKKDDTDPNLFVRLPPGQRPLKFSVASQFDWGRFELLNSIAGPSRSSFHCVYQRSGLPVLASFRAEDLITNFYPELAQGLNKKIQTSLASLDLLQAFKRLSSHERQDPELAISNMINFSQNFMDSLEPASGQNSSRSAAIPVRTGTTGTNRRSAGGNNGGKKSRNGSSAGATTITKTNLDALQSALGGSASGEGVAGGKGALGASILTASRERVVDPAAAATTSARSSKADRAARKHRLLNRLSSVSAAL